MTRVHHVPDLVRGKRLELFSGDTRIVVDRKRDAICVPYFGEIRARFRNRYVYLLVGAKQLEMTTPVAVKLGLALANNGGACMYHGDTVTLEVGGEEFCLPPAIAIQLGGVMARKADRADDWQRETAV